MAKPLRRQHDHWQLAGHADNFYVACGFSGHGFMHALASAADLPSWLCTVNTAPSTYLGWGTSGFSTATATGRKASVDRGGSPVLPCEHVITAFPSPRGVDDDRS
jgi:hypothetical protein